jgi:SAM-dependent methyltransferase
MTHITFRQKAEKHWTPERLRKLTGGKSYLIEPLAGAELLRSIGLLNADASMPADAVRKYIQINHMVALLHPTLNQLSERFSVLRILDCGCGNSYLTFLLAWCFKNLWKKKAHLTGIDTRADVIAKSAARAKELGLEEFLSFEKISVQDYQKRREEIADTDERKASRSHVIVGLHACDTATDDALALAFSEKADAVAVAPCCQAELANRWRKLSAEQFKSAFSVLIQSPELRRDSCSTFTDAMRVLLMRGQGYEVTTTEFVPSAHTPKNRLILAQRRGNYFEPALVEYVQLRNALGAGIGLEVRLAGEPGQMLQRLVEAK